MSAVWAELVHWRASRRRLGQGRVGDGTDAVVVLGYRSRGNRVNAVNRYRVRAGLRSLDPAAGRSVLVLCGGPTAGDVPEADLLERHARRLGYTGAVRLDRTSRTTWENIENAIPLIEDAHSIAIVSSSLHAEKARAYLWRQRPDLADRLRRGADHRFGEVTWAKPAAAVLGLWNLRGLSTAGR
ncbi:YdcF family protein [Cellulomonas sp. zg-ZUI222]|uniref:YdcF family protein n=2 Tax=Cellulomonadaceae TaxID=85016 RepID=A0ABX8DAB9_9CELL|nr:YdcF family protein [Cellulomonas sp. zg-ZUI22]MBO0919476.1 YdcF family protein [Cellulomonas wangleii]MBO0924384.1 YdcF family protein [Cellulomonas wangleii]QVI64399.1 YdcF family protein [Cellulomonas wangleii]